MPVTKSPVPDDGPQTRKPGSESGGAGRHRGIHTESISAENGETGKRDRGRRGQTSGHGRGGWQAVRKSSARNTACSGNNCRGTVGQKSVIDNCVA
jgi:hypothetical protein